MYHQSTESKPRTPRALVQCIFAIVWTTPRRALTPLHHAQPLLLVALRPSSSRAPPPTRKGIKLCREKYLNYLQLFYNQYISWHFTFAVLPQLAVQCAALRRACYYHALFTHFARIIAVGDQVLSGAILSRTRRASCEATPIRSAARLPETSFV